MRLRGVAHAHSTYSYDGCHSLREIVEFLRERGLDFVLMSEHNRTLGEAEVAACVAECDALSDERFLVVPGLECEATPDHVHVLAYNVRALIGSRQALDIVRAARRLGGFAVLAHPHYRDAFTHVDQDTVDLLHGWEVWNGKADGGWAPPPSSVERHAALRRSHGRLLPLAGADLHRLESYPGITIEVDCEGRTAAAILRGLGEGSYVVAGRGFRFSGREPLRVPPGEPFTVLGTLTRGLRRWAQRLDRRLAHRGLRAPEPLYRLARRLLK